MKINPLKLFKSNRFDVAAKLIYAEFFMKKINSSWGEEVYLQHLKVWNNFKETVEPTKNSKEKFINKFNEILLSMKELGFDEKFPVLINDSKELSNGGHRLASSIYNSIDCEYVVEDREGYGQSDCYYHYFANKKNFVPEGLSLEYLDAMAIEYCKRKTNTFIVSVFPIGANRCQEIEQIINQYSSIVYKKIVEIDNETLAKNLLWHFYYKEEWIGEFENGLSGIQEKYNLCFNKNKKQQMVYYLIDCEEKNVNMIEVKERIRKLFNVGKHSVHINDTHKQTIRIANLVFNENSIFAMSKIKFNKDLKKFNELMGLLRDADWQEDMCVTSSFVMGLFGIREIKDIDYISFNDQSSSICGISNHFSEKQYYSKTFDDIIFNPKNYFYFNDIKFCTLNVVKEMKMNRREEKDIEDIKRIERFYEK